MTLKSNILPFAPKALPPATEWTAPLPLPTLKHITLLTLDGRFFATAGFLPGSIGDAWAWVQETVAREAGCHEDDVHVLEDPEGEFGDLITADGMPVYQFAN